MPTPTFPHEIPAEWIGDGTRADDKRAGALCTREQCIARQMARKERGQRGVFLVTADGRLAVKHGRGSAQERRVRAANLLAIHPDCTWCGKELDATTIEQDRIIPACEYRPRNIVAACKACNNERNKITTADEAAAFAARDASNPVAVARIAAIVAAHPDFHTD